ncbi:unnamed protein product [Boreogadus saida]
MDDERLVLEVEKYLELYDQSSRHYKDNSKKDIAWRAIGLEIGSSVGECKARWKGLRDAFVKHRKKVQHLPSGSGATSQRDWRYSNLMSFLVPFMPSRSTTGNLEASEPGQNTQDTQEEEAQEQQEDAAPPPRTERMAAQHATAASRRRHRSRSPSTLSVVAQMDRLNTRNQTKAKMTILQVLDELETSQESRPTPYPVPYERHRICSELLDKILVYPLLSSPLVDWVHPKPSSSPRQPTAQQKKGSHPLSGHNSLFC